MRIGFSLLNNWGVADVQALVELARRAEQLGVDSVWAHDHVFNVGHVFDRIGGRPYYEPPPREAGEALEMVAREVVPAFGS